MIRKLLRLFEKIVPHSLRIPVLAGLALLIVALIFVYGVRISNGIGNRVHDVKVWIAKKEIQQANKEKEAATQVATQAIAAFKAEVELRKEEEAKRVILEKILVDKTKNTDQKLAAYEAAMRARPVVTGPESDAELCRRAVALGIAVRCD